VVFPARVLIKFTVSLEQGGLTSNAEYSLNWPRNIEIIGTKAVIALRKIWTLLHCLYQHSLLVNSITSRCDLSQV
jgi:hypothetical protein